MTATHVTTGMGLQQILEVQRTAFVADGIPSAAVRRDRLDRLGALLADNRDELVDALTADFGTRARELSVIGDIHNCLLDIAEQHRHVGRWMREAAPLRLLDITGVRARVRHDPLGVVGVVGPWNFPLQLSIVPAAAAIAAGNRVMVRPSSVTHRTSETLARLSAAYLTIEEFVVITRDHGTGSDFTKLAFDSLFFTGSPAVGASVAADAARNLTPVTLELGGKNPVVVDRDADIDRAARLVAAARLTNSGQVCLCPDYVFVPEEQIDRFVDAVVGHWRRSFPTVLANPDYTSIINDANYTRINSLVSDAVQLGARARTHIPHGESLPDDRSRKIAPTVLTGVHAGMQIEQTEVFGPVLTVYPYTDIEEPIAFINRHDHPLTLYWHGPRNHRLSTLVGSTRSGSVQCNDFLVNMLPFLPFGGVGRSGMGSYHGVHGFATFTHQRAVVHNGSPIRLSHLVAPPYGRGTRQVTRVMNAVLGCRYRTNPPQRTPQ